MTTRREVPREEFLHFMAAAPGMKSRMITITEPPTKEFYVPFEGNTIPVAQYVTMDYTTPPRREYFLFCKPGETYYEMRKRIAGW